MSKNERLKLSSLGENGENIEGVRKENKIWEEIDRRKENKHKHKLFVITLYILWSIVVIVLLIRVYHFVSHKCYQWMSTEQIQLLDRSLLSAIVGGVLNNYKNKITGSDNE